MITISLPRPGKMTPQEILQMLRERAGKEPVKNDPWLKYAQWISENNIDACIPNNGEISFINDEDAVAFRLKFGI